MKHVLIALVVAFLLAVPATPVYAVGGCVAGGAAAIAIGAGTQAVAVATGIGGAVPIAAREPGDHLDSIAKNETIQTTKDCVLDGLTVAIREALIATITQSIIDWINNGFEGGPAFVTDPTGFLRDVADKIGLEFILGEELSFLCSPFQLQVRLALSTKQRSFQQDVQCSLGDVSDNIQGFLSGDFSQGGWPAWFRFSTDIQNNPIGAYFLVEAELEGRQSRAVAEQEREWSWSGGFFSKKKCVEYGGSLGPDSVTDASGLPAICLKEEIVTPGKQIEGTLAKWMGLGADQLALADEIDEIIGALLQQLAQKALTSLDGLRGLSSNSSSSAVDGRSYLDQLTQTTGDTATAAAKDVLLLEIGGSIATENQYQGVLNDTLAILADEKALLSSCLVGVETGTGVSLASIGMKTQQYKNALATATSTSARLATVYQRAQNAVTASNLNVVGAEYDALAQSGVLQTSTTLALAATARDLEQSTLDALVAAGGTQCVTRGIQGFQ
jgi:hypothetical protein